VQSIAHLRVLAPPSESAGVTNELTAIVGEPSIEMLQMEAVESEPRELVWLLNLPGQVTPRWHPQPVLCEPNIEDEAELRFVQIHRAELFRVGIHIDESRRKRGWSNAPLGEWPRYQSSQLYSMGRSCCIFTRSVISTYGKESKQKDVDMKLNVMHKTGYCC
jgi:hypothetical protein